MSSDENSQRISVCQERMIYIILSCVDERPKRRIEMYAFYDEQNI